MARMQHKIYQRRNRQRRIRRLTLALALLCAALGLLSRFRSHNALSVDPVLLPTATPLSAAFDETSDSRTVMMPASIWYALQTGIYSDRAAAEQTAAKYEGRGAPGFVLAQDGKYRVLIACYGSKADAESVRIRLSDKQSVDTYVYEWPCSELSMQMTGMAGQLDVVEAALSLLDDTAAQLRDLAIACDRGEFTFDEASATVSGMQEQLMLLSETLKSRFTQPYPSFVSIELSQLETAAALLTPLTQCNSITDFSARLKLQSMALYQQMIDLRMLLLDM